eukprot:180463_1
MQSVLSVSILLSLLSISMSLYLFCHSIYWKLFIFNCLCVLSDIMKLFTLIILVNAMDTIFVYLWCVKLLFITASCALYLSIQFIWNKIAIDADLNSNWYQIMRNFGAEGLAIGGRSRSISRSQSKSKSKSTNTNTSTHLSTYHISDSKQNKSQRRHRSTLWHFIAQSACISSSQTTSEVAFVILFGAAVALLWPFMILFLEISSFSLIAFVIDRLNTARFVLIHSNLWHYIFAFVLKTKYVHRMPHHLAHHHHHAPDPSSRSQTLITATCTTMRTLSPTDSEHEDMSYGDHDAFNEIELSQISQISQQHNCASLDATELEVRLNTLANSGGGGAKYKRNHRVKKQQRTSKTYTNTNRYWHRNASRQLVVG